MKLAWMNDLHLEFAQWDVLQSFFGALKESEADTFLVGGDISQSPMVCTDLAMLAGTLERPVRFVLGNHDFYKGSIEGTRAKVRELDDANEVLTYLSRSGPVPLGPNQASCRLSGCDTRSVPRLKLGPEQSLQSPVPTQPQPVMPRRARCAIGPRCPGLPGRRSGQAQTATLPWRPDQAWRPPGSPPRPH